VFYYLKKWYLIHTHASPALTRSFSLIEIRIRYVGLPTSSGG